MSKEIKYISYEEVLDVYHKTIEASDGGFEGIRDENAIHYTLDIMQNDDFYRTFSNKLTCLVYNFCAGHLVNDGCKRIALTIGAYFLHKNEYYWHACIFIRQLEAIIYHVAASNIDKELLERVIDCFMSGKDYDEELKIDIAKAMNKGELGIKGEDYDNER